MLINMNAVATTVLNDEHRDFFLGGTCDGGVREFAKELGWDEELERMRADDLKSNGSRSDKKVVEEEKDSDELLVGTHDELKISPL